VAGSQLQPAVKEHLVSEMQWISGAAHVQDALLWVDI
jgi:hypothetical protein